MSQTYLDQHNSFTKTNTPGGSGLKGTYNDCLIDSSGQCLWESGWQNNRVVERCHRLLAALMKREAGMSGILYWAVGEGLATWDRLMPSPNAGDTQLATEIARLALMPEQILYLDNENEISDEPTARLQISTTFTREALGGQGIRSLREFGLFGGDATETANSGWMIDYVIHPRIALSPGMTLTRNLHLTFGIGTGVGTETVGGFGSTLPVISIDGVGEQFSVLLNAAGVNTLNDLIEIDPLQTISSIPGVKLREFRAKARMVMGFRADLLPFASLSEQNISTLLKTEPETIASEIGLVGTVTSSHVIQMQETLAILQVALDDAALQEISLGRLLST